MMNTDLLENFLLRLYDGPGNFKFDRGEFYGNEYGIVQFKTREVFNRFLRYMDGNIPSSMEDYSDPTDPEHLKKIVFDIGHSDMVVHYSLGVDIK